MDLAGGKYPCVKIKGFKAYATNGGAMSVRSVEFKEEGFIDKHFLPQLKGIYATDKKKEFTDNSLAHYIISEFAGFPDVDLDKMFNEKFEYEIIINADLITKMVKSMKSKENKVIMKIKDKNSPILFIHENGKGLVAPLLS